MVTHDQVFVSVTVVSPKTIKKKPWEFEKILSVPSLESIQILTVLKLLTHQNVQCRFLIDAKTDFQKNVKSRNNH